MKTKFKQLIFSLFVLLAIGAGAQVSGVKNIPTDYPTLSAAINTLNAQGVGIGGATINVPAGYTETLTAGLALKYTLNASGVANPLTIIKSGSGANPLVTAQTGTSTTIDGIFTLVGADYVTINGIDLAENAANTTATTGMEWGYGLCKNSGTDGCQYVTIKNCSVTLTKTLSATNYGIYSANHTNTINTAFTVTNFAGTNSNNKFYNNSIQNCYWGIYLVGFSSAAPYDLFDQNNQIGVDGTSSRRNQITNYGGLTTTAYGVNQIYQNNFKCFNTYFNNGGGVNGAHDVYGLLTGAAINANVDIYNDTLNLVSAGTTQGMYGIYNVAGGTGAGNTVNIYGNVVAACNHTTATSGVFYGIYNQATATYANMYNNKFINNTHSGTGTYAGIYYSGSSSTLVKTVNIYSNLVNGNTKTGASGIFYSIYENASPNTINTYSNTITNNSCTASGNSITFYGIYNNAAPPFEKIYSNQISNCIGGGTFWAIQATTGGGTNKDIYLNAINSCTSNGQIGGINASFGTISNIYNNNLHNIVSTSTVVSSPNVVGIFYGASSNFVNNTYNNFISNLQAPNVSNAFALAGILLDGTSGSSNHYVYNNSIYLNASSSGSIFGSTAVHYGNNPVTIDLRNNILVNVSTPAGTGTTSVIRRTQTTLAPMNLLSGYNCMFAGTPGGSNVIMTDGTNNFVTLQNYKDAVTPRDQASFTGLPPFVNISSLPYDLHLQTTVATQCEGGGQALPIVPTDFDNQTRSTPFCDVGADEFSGITSQIAAPNIIYTPLTNGPVASNRTLTAFATITDPSGINNTISTRPRLYYKKSTDANAWVGNTSSDNSWKYVEATNTSSPYNFVINYSLLQSAVSASDVIQYFVVAQDLASTPVVGINSGSFSALPTSVNLGTAQFPLGSTINQYTIVGTSFSGTVNVSSTDTYTSLTNSGGIFEAINNGVLSGNLTIGINGSLTAESGSIALNQWAEDGVGNYSVFIVPTAASSRLITGTNTAQSLIRFNGADRVTIDGRFSGSGQYLTFRNQTTSAPAIGYLNDAQNNNLLYSIIESNNVNTTVNSLLGAVNIGTTSLQGGNDNITISNCEFRDRSDIAATPNVLIGCSGSNSYPSQNNNNINISNNTIHDWFVINGTSQNAISIGTGNSDYTISANSFYQTVARTHTVNGSVMRAIFISNSSPLNINGNFNVHNNYIGGTAPLCAGGDMTISVTGTNIGTIFNGMSISTGQIPNSVQGNVIRAIDYTTQAPATAVSNFVGIGCNNGIYSIGTTTGNAIGSSTVNGAIKITVNAGATQNVFLAPLLYANTNGYGAIANNTIGGITIAGTNTNSCFNQLIQVQGSPLASQTTTVVNNLIGSQSIANSIQNNSNMNMNSFGLRMVITSGAPLSVTNNTFMNITDNSTNTACSNYGVFVVSSVGGSAPVTISNNVLKNMVVNTTPLVAGFSNYGISIQSYGGAGHSIASNTISGLYNNNTSASANSYVSGMQFSGATLAGNISKNYIYDLRNANTGAFAGLQGMYFTSSNDWTVSNNMLSVTNGTNTNNMLVGGITDFMSSGSSLKLYYNSVFVGGDNGSGIANSAAYLRGANSDNILRNNVFYNNRIGSSAIHPAISVTTTAGWAGTVISNNNVFIGSDTTKLIVYGTGTLSLSGYKVASGSDIVAKKEINTVETPTAVFVNTANGDLHRNTSNFFGGVAAPISILDDIDGQSRSASGPMAGADEFCITPNTPTNTTSGGSLVYCAGATTTLLATAGTYTVNWFTAASGGSSIGTGTSIVTSSTLAAGTRTYYAEAVSGCTVSAGRTAVVFTVNPSPTITVNSGAICVGSTFTMTPSGALTYTFSNGSNTVSPGSTTAYSVTGTSTDGCVSSVAAISNVSINPSPTLNVAVTGSVCSGFSVGLTASGANTYTWNTGANTTSISVSPSVSTTYTINASSALGCTASTTRSVTVAQNPTLIISGSSGICTGQTATLNVSGANTYTWNTGSNGNSITSAPTSNTTYTVSGTDANGCVNTATQLVTVAASLSISIVGPSTICIGQPANLTGNGGVTYTWSTGSTAQTIAPSPSVTTTYSVIGASGTCSNSGVATVSVNPIPTVAIAGNFTICSGQTTTLTASGANTYSWSSGPATATAAVSPTVTQVYTVTGTNAFGCAQNASVTITSNPLSNLVVTQSAGSVCVNSPATFTASGASTYTWNNTVANATVALTPTAFATAIYTVNGTNSFGCVSSRTIALGTFSLPVISITPSSATVCALSTATFTGSGASTYTWNGTVTTATAAFTPSANSIYTLTGASSLGCLTNATVAVTTNSLPVLSITPSSATVCALSTASFTGAGANTYTWTGAIVSSTAAFSPSVNTVYTLSGASAQGCISNATLGITTNSIPVITISPASASVCANSSSSYTASGANTYTWSSVSNNTVVAISPSVSSVYTVSGTNAAGCISNATLSLNVYALPSLTISPASPTVCAMSQLSLNASGANTYTWNSSIQGSSATFTPATSTVYTLSGESVNNCVSTVTMAVTTNSLPVVSVNPSSLTICAFSAASFTANGASTYTWSNAVSGSTVSFFTGSNAVYSVTGTSSDGCNASATVQVATNPLPSLTLTPSFTTVCANSPATFSASGASTYSWSSGATTASAVITASIAAAYTVTGTDALGCSASTVAIVVTNTLPAISISPATSTVCALSPVTVTASGAVSYTWNTGSNSASATLTPSANTVYTVLGTDAGNGCVGSQTIAIVTNSLPVISVTASSPSVCPGNAVTLNASGATSFTWNVNGSNATSITDTPTVATVYTVSGTDNNGCTSNGTVNVGLFNLPSITVTPSQATICVNEVVILTASGANTYTWSPGITSGPVFTATPASLTQYSVIGTDANTCTNTAVVSVFVTACAGINGISPNSHLISVFPNPSAGSVTTKFEFDGRKTIQIFNEIGQIIETRISENSIEHFDLLPYAKGIYYVKINSTQGSGNFKIVVQ